MNNCSLSTLSYLPMLIVGAHGVASIELAEHFRNHGFSADIARSCQEAQTAAHARYYGSMIFIGDLAKPADMVCLSKLRRTSIRTWIIVISSSVPPEDRRRTARRDADAILIAPFSIEDLTSRLLALSLRSRPL